MIKVESEIYNKKTGETSKNERFYISSKEASATKFGSYTKGHWEIESMHWSLDVIFGEDFQAKRNKKGILNFNTLSKCAISLLVEEKTVPKIQTSKTAESLLHNTAFL